MVKRRVNWEGRELAWLPLMHHRLDPSYNVDWIVVIMIMILKVRLIVAVTFWICNNVLMFPWKKYIEVKREAAAALCNMTLADSIKKIMAFSGTIPALLELSSLSDNICQVFAIRAISNLAESGKAVRTFVQIRKPTTHARNY